MSLLISSMLNFSGDLGLVYYLRASLVIGVQSKFIVQWHFTKVLNCQLKRRVSISSSNKYYVLTSIICLHFESTDIQGNTSTIMMTSRGWSSIWSKKLVLLKVSTVTVRLDCSYGIYCHMQCRETILYRFLWKRCIGPNCNRIIDSEKSLLQSVFLLENIIDNIRSQSSKRQSTVLLILPFQVYAYSYGSWC